MKRLGIVPTDRSDASRAAGVAGQLPTKISDGVVLVDIGWFNVE